MTKLAAIRDYLLVTIGLLGVILLLIYLTGGSAAVTSYFSYPSGVVWGNEVATVILLPGALVALLRKIEKNHREKLAQDAKHHQEQMQAHADATEHRDKLHAELLRHLNASGR